MSEVNTDSLDGTVFISDNLPFLKSLDSESIDLVCIDPPFGKRQTFEGTLKPPLTADEQRAEQELMSSWGIYDVATAYEFGLEFPDQTGTTAKFDDIWSFRVRVFPDWYKTLKESCPGAWWLIESALRTHSESTAAYVAFMVERMLEVRRVLKSTGSVYLHCDHEANAYLRQMMDAVLGPENFRRELIWSLKTASGFKSAADNFVRSHETILYYSKDRARCVFNKTFKGYSDAYLARFKKVDGDGRRYRDDRPGGRRQYLDESKGVPLTDVWDDIMSFQQNSTSVELTGYPTQKPQALARRIIEASTVAGDIVLDCFAGCAYVPVAAQITGRRWIACDMSPRAWTVVRRQFHKHPDLGIVTEGEIDADGNGSKVEPKLATAGRTIRVRGPNQLPVRSALDEPLELPVHEPRPVVRYRQRPLETGQEIWDAFIQEWGARCWYCGTRKVEDRREIHLDHVERNQRDGSNDDCWNRALACSICNSNKGAELTPEATIDIAFQQGLIETEALRREVAEGFVNRMTWAKLRWERISSQSRVDPSERLSTTGSDRGTAAVD